MKNCILAILALVAAFNLAGQVSSGTLVGDVRDETSALVAGVEVAARHNATGSARSNDTGPIGAYQFSDLAPGRYTITAEKPGFRTITASDVLIEVDHKSRLDLDLKVGSEHETVTVTASATPVQTEDASAGYTLDHSTIQSLPLDGRNITSLMTLGPGAIPRQLSGLKQDLMNDQQQARGAVAMNPPINGARSTMNTFLLDGSYNMDRNVFAIAIVPPIESVQEFRIQSSLGSAEFAQSGGGIIDVVTKSGSRTFHGNAFELLRNEATDARGFFDAPSLPRAKFRQNQYGGSLGGPLLRHSTFFFVSYEGLRNTSAKSTLHLVPDATVRTGNFAGRSTIFDPLKLDASGNRVPFANNVIPANRIDPIAARFLSKYEPLPNHVTGDPSTNFLDATPNTIDKDSVSGRVDRQLGRHGWLFGRYSLNEDGSVLSGNFPELPTIENLRAQQAMIGHTYTGSRWVNEARLSFTRLRVFDVPQSAFKTNILQDLGINSGPTNPFSYGLPYFVVTDFDNVTDSTLLPQVQRDNTWQASDGVSVVRGRHTLKTGIQWVH